MASSGRFIVNCEREMERDADMICVRYWDLGRMLLLAAVGAFQEDVVLPFVESTRMLRYNPKADAATQHIEGMVQLA
jgi:hypothetical protein